MRVIQGNRSAGPADVHFVGLKSAQTNLDIPQLSLRALGLNNGCFLYLGAQVSIESLVQFTLFQCFRSRRSPCAFRWFHFVFSGQIVHAQIGCG